MKKIILILSGILGILVIVFLFVVFRKSAILIPTPTPTPTVTQFITPTIMIYPEYLLPTPESLAPPDDPNTYEKLPKDQQEFSSLVVTLPIKTSDYSVEFNFANSTFSVVIKSDQGMRDYEALRQKYPNLKDALFTVVDQRIER